MAKKVKIKSILKNKFLIAFLVIAVAAGGAYAIINSPAAAPSGLLGVTVTNSATGAAISGANINTNPNDGSYNCSSYPNPYNQPGYFVNSGNTDSSGYVSFSCLTFLGNTGKQYTLSVTKPGYISNGDVTVRIPDGSTTGVSMSLRPAPAPTPPPPAPTPPPPAPTPPPPAPTPTPIGLPSASTSCNKTTGQVSLTASFSGYGRPSPYNVDVKPQSMGDWGNGGFFRQVSGSPVTLSSFNGWASYSGQTLTISPSTAYRLRIAYNGGAEHSGEIRFSSVACVKDSGGGNPNPPPQPPPKKNGGTSKIVARAPAAPTNPADTTKPTAPANLTAEQIGNGEVDLTWDESTDEAGIDSYTVERSEDGVDWTILDDAVLITSYSDTTADFGVTYSYRVSAKDKSGNFSDYAVVDIETNSFSANVYADEDSSITSEDGIVTVNFPAGSLSEDAYCEVSKDTVRANPKGYKLAAGGYIIECKNSQGDSITQLDKAAKVTMDLKSSKYKSYVAYSIDSDGKLEQIKSTFNSKTGELSFEISDLSNAFAAYGKSGGSAWWLWLIILLILILAVIAFIRWRRSRSESAEDAYYDSAGYVTMPPTAPVGPNGGPDGTGGYEQHTSLPDLVAQGQQQQQQPQQPYQEFPPAPPLQGQPGEFPEQDPNQYPPQSPTK